MDAITVMFVLFLFLLAVFFTLIVRRDWLAREELERYRRRQLYASHGNARLSSPVRGVRPAPSAARHTTERTERQHFDPKNAARDEAPGETLVAAVKD